MSNYLVLYAPWAMQDASFVGMIEADDPNAVWAKMNQDNRPFAQEVPSMSVGDMALDLDTGRLWQCENVGFSEMAIPHPWRTPQEQTQWLNQRLADLRNEVRRIGSYLGKLSPDHWCEICNLPPEQCGTPSCPIIQKVESVHPATLSPLEHFAETCLAKAQADIGAMPGAVLVDILEPAAGGNWMIEMQANPDHVIGRYDTGTPNGEVADVWADIIKEYILEKHGVETVLNWSEVYPDCLACGNDEIGGCLRCLQPDTAADTGRGVLLAQERGRNDYATD